MRDCHSRRYRSGAIGYVMIGLFLCGPAVADDPTQINVTLKDHRFDPAEIHVRAGKPTNLLITNQDAAPEEFDSSALKVEKIIPAGHYAIVRLRPLGPGRYPFVGEFHPDTAKGVVVSE